MSTIIRHSENNNTHFLVPLDKKFADKTAYIDVTDILTDAMQADRKHGYSGAGPAYGVEATRAFEYAAYVSEYATMENFDNFNVAGKYLCVVSSLTDEQIAKNAIKRFNKRK